MIIVTEKPKESASVMQHFPVAVGSPTHTYSVVYTALLKFGQDLSDVVVGVVLVADMCDTYLQKAALYYIRVIYPIVVLS